jgi:hypothetical protein
VSRLIMVTRQDPGQQLEAEPVTVSVAGDQLDLVLDDGTELSFDLREFEQALAGEQAPGEGAQAA